MVARVLAPGRAHEVVGPAYDALTAAERRRFIDTSATSFFGVIRSSLEFPEADPDELAAANAAALAHLLDAGYYLASAAPALYVYELRTPEHSQVAVIGDVPIDAMAKGQILAHEATRQAKERDLAAHLRAVGVQSSPVALGYRASPAIDQLVADATRAAPMLDFRAHDDVRHRVWRLDAERSTALIAGFSAVPRTYIVDGHHRVGAAVRAGAPALFVALLADHQLRLFPYHRLVSDPPEDLVGRLAALAGGPLDSLRLPASGRAVVVMPDGSAWEVPLEAGPGEPDVAAADRILLPALFDIGDVRTDPRLSYLPGHHDVTSVLDRQGRGRAALLLRAISVPDLLAFADAGRMLPPKSTWFDPKLRSGLFVVTR